MTQLKFQFQKVSASQIKQMEAQFVQGVYLAFLYENIDFMREFIKSNIRESETYSSLIGDGGKYSLMAEFGLPYAKAKSMVDAVIDVIGDNIEYKVMIEKEQGKQVVALYFYVLVADYKDIIYLDEATVTTDKGQTLPWLEWLLLNGRAKNIIKGYTIVRKQGFSSSRSGFALMRKAKGKNWKVPAEFAGTKNDNWLTRLLDSITEEFLNQIEEFVVGGNTDVELL